MKNIALAISLFLINALLFACSTETIPAEKPQLVETASQPSQTDAGLPSGGWQAEWEKLVSAAKKEGKLSLYTSIGSNGRDAITEGFQKKYGIDVEYTAGRGNDLAEKITREDRAGLHMADLFHSGTTTMFGSLKAYLEPVEPKLVLPEVLDTKMYWDGKLPWRDEDKLTVAILAYPAPSLFINTTLVKPDEIKSYQDLLNPKWKGKIVMLDPIRPGSGQKWVHVIGPRIMGWDFIRDLLKQDIMIHVDQPIMAQWLARGKYAISIGVASEHVLPLEEAGAPVTTTRPKEGAYLTSGSFAFGVIRNPPHPNATRLFVNWALSKEGQTAYSKSVRQHGIRVDVPTELLMPAFTRQPGDKYIISDDEEYDLTRKKNDELARKIFEPYWK